MVSINLNQSAAATRQNAKLFKQVFMLCFVTFFIPSAFSATGIFEMCTENSMENCNDSIVSSSVLSINSTAFKWWKTLPLDSEKRIHLFNYTNADRYMKGLDEKLIIEDLGPYVYVEKYEKVNVIFNKNNTVSYHVKRSYQFLPEKSKGHEDDNIIVPNIKFLYLSSQLRGQSPLLQLIFSAISTQLKNSTPFKALKAYELLWTFDDDIYGPSMRKRVSPDVFTIFTGEDDFSKVSIINNLNGEEKINFWSTDECNKIDGTDGAQFPLNWLDKKQPLQVFTQGLCRKLPLIYEKDVEAFNNLSVWRYKMPLNVFSHPDNNTANECYCDSKTSECSPNGIFNVSLCFGGPMFLSLPHFFTGDPSLFENIEGLMPDESKHSTYIDVHPGSGISISGVARFQWNVQVQKENLLNDLIPLKDGQYLPILWAEVAPTHFSDEIQEEFKTLFT